MKRENYSSGGKWEDIVGYSRAVKVGNLIEVAGTTATNEKGEAECIDAYGQTLFILNKISEVLIRAGSNMEHVIRTRIYVTDIKLWEEIGKAHGEFFRTIKPASTMIEVNALIHPQLLVEIEVSAIISES